MSCCCGGRAQPGTRRGDAAHRGRVGPAHGLAPPPRAGALPRRRRPAAGLAGAPDRRRRAPPPRGHGDPGVRRLQQHACDRPEAVAHGGREAGRERLRPQAAVDDPDRRRRLQRQRVRHPAADQRAGRRPRRHRPHPAAGRHVAERGDARLAQRHRREADRARPAHAGRGRRPGRTRAGRTGPRHRLLRLRRDRPALRRRGHHAGGPDDRRRPGRRRRRACVPDRHRQPRRHDAGARRLHRRHRAERAAPHRHRHGDQRHVLPRAGRGAAREDLRLDRPQAHGEGRAGGDHLARSPARRCCCWWSAPG